MKQKIKYGGFVFEQEERDAIERALKGDIWLLGEETKTFEKELAEYIGTKHSLFVNSGSSALLTAALALKERYGEGEVIVPAITFPTAVSALVAAGFAIRVIKSDEYLSIDPEELRMNINPNTVGVLVVHVAGSIGKIDEIKGITEENGLFLLEDNCDGFGGTYKGKKCGTYGHISATSFHAAHIISTGQGGATFTDDDSLANAMRSYAQWGRIPGFDDGKKGISPLPDDYMQRYTYSRLGFNFVPLELQAAVGRSQLSKVERFKSARRRNFDYLRERVLKECHSYNVVPVNYVDAEPCWFACPLFVPNRATVFGRLDSANIEYRNILAGNITLHPLYRRYPFEILDAPEDVLEDRKIVEDGFWVPVHPSITEEQLIYMGDVLVSAIGDS